MSLYGGSQNLCSMRTVIQRVHEARVVVGKQTVGQIGPGLVLFLGISRDDTNKDLEWLVDKVPRIRCFEDAKGRMNTSLAEANKEAMIISQFTLFGNLRKGTRPSFNEAALPEQAIPLYETFIEELQKRLQKPVASGAFGAHMDIDMRQDGPVTLLIDTKRRDF